MKYDAIIFDIDGTLWSASAASVKGFNRGLDALNEEERVTIEEMESVTGMPYAECVDMLLPNLRQKHPELLNILNKHEFDVIKEEGGIFYPGVIKGIKALSKTTPVYLVSNCQEFYMHLFLKLSGLESYIIDFDCNGMSGQPKGEMLKSMVARNKLKKAVYVGDTAGDESGAQQAGIDFIYVSYGFGQPENECMEFDSFEKLLDYLR